MTEPPLGQPSGHRTGRFTTRDTIGIWGDPGNLGNGYAYANNNPWTMVDPYGLGVGFTDHPTSYGTVVRHYYDEGWGFWPKKRWDYIGTYEFDPNDAAEAQKAQDLVRTRDFQSTARESSAAAKTAIKVVGSFNPFITAVDAGTGQDAFEPPTEEHRLGIGNRALAVGAVACGALKMVDKANDASRAARALEEAAEDMVNAHHAWPKYLGGPAKQALEDLPGSLHRAYHTGLDRILPRQRGTDYYRALSPQQQAENFERLRKYTEAFDAKHGTNLWDAIKTAASANE